MVCGWSASKAIRGKVRQADAAVKEWWLTIEGNLQRYFRSDGKKDGMRPTWPEKCFPTKRCLQDTMRHLIKPFRDF